MRRIRPATVTLAVCAILFGLVSAYGVRRYLEPPVVVAPRGTSVVVPRVNLPRYARIREQDLEVVELPPGKLADDVLRAPNRALFRLCREAIPAGQPLRESDLYGVGEAPTLAEQLPPGYRAVTIAVADDQALGGMLLPESFVDVSLTVRGSHPELGGVATLTLMENVKVLATSGNRFKGEERVDQSLRSITLAATPEQANKLILAERYGNLSVTLRGAIEADAAATAAAPRNHLVNGASLLGLPPVAPVRTVTAEIWRGGAVEQVTFRAERIQESRAATIVAERGNAEALPVGYRGAERPDATDGAARATRFRAAPFDATPPRLLSREAAAERFLGADDLGLSEAVAVGD